MDDIFVKRFLQAIRRGWDFASIARMKLYNEIMTILKKFNAVTDSLDVDLSKVPFEEQKIILNKIMSAYLSYNRIYSPFPDDLNEFNIASIKKNNGLQIDAYGSHHDTLARKIIAELIKISYNLQVKEIDGTVVYNTNIWSNAAKISKGTEIIGIMRHVSNDRKTGEEQIRADFKIGCTKIKVLAKYEATFPLLEMYIQCPPEAVEKGYTYFKEHEKKFHALTCTKE